MCQQILHHILQSHAKLIITQIKISNFSHELMMILFPSLLLLEESFVVLDILFQTQLFANVGI